MKKRYRLLLSAMLLGSVIIPTSSLAENRKKPPRRSGNAQAARDRGQLTSLDTLRTFGLNRTHGTQQSQNQNTTSTATPPPPTVSATQGTQQSQNQNATPTATPPTSAVAAHQGTQQPQGQHVTIQATPPSPTVPTEQSTVTASSTNRGTQPNRGKYTLPVSQAVLRGERKSIYELSPRRTGGRGPQQHNTAPTQTPPPRETERAQTNQQSSAQNTSTDPNRANPFIQPASPSKDTTNSQSVANDSLNQAEQPTIPQSQEQQTPPTSEATSGVLTGLLEQLQREHPIDANQSTVSLDELLQQLSNPSAHSNDTVANNDQAPAPNNPSSMSVKQGIALLQGLNIALDGSNRPSPENREMAADAAHEVLLDLNAIYHYEGDGLLGITSHFGHELFNWVQSYSFANFRKESVKEAMRAFAQKLLAKFEGDADFRRECEMLEEHFIQKQEDYQTNCARACMQVVSLFLHPETV